jgi:arylsulfatase A-like enzyme
VLGERGWNTYHVGKWHLCAEDEMNLASSKRQWPLGRGFERYYGFLGGETNQWYPDLVHDNHPVAPPKSPEQGYHLTVDLTDKAIEFIQDAKAIAPDKPFFMYFCPGAAHAPHHVPNSALPSSACMISATLTRPLRCVPACTLASSRSGSARQTSL